MYNQKTMHLHSFQLVLFRSSIVNRTLVMSIGKFNPRVIEVMFTNEMVYEFNAAYKGDWTIDELVLHPREALNFRDDVRRKRSWMYVPDDILKSR